MNEQYMAALVRADKLGIKIVGRGRWVDGRAFFLVSSATSNRPHIVTVDSGGRENCDCLARTAMCMHIAVSRRQLSQDAEATAAHLERIRRAMDEEREANNIKSAAASLVATDASLARSGAILAHVSASLDAADRRKAEDAKRETAMLASRAANRPVSMWASA